MDVRINARNGGNAFFHVRNVISRHQISFLLSVAALITIWTQAAAAEPSQANTPAEMTDPFVSLGFDYDNGIGVPQNAKKAAKLYRGSADQGHVFAQFSLGALYEKGRGVPQDYVEAYKWYSLAGDIEQRDKLATKMSPLQIEEAKQVVRAWKPGEQ